MKACIGTLDHILIQRKGLGTLYSKLFISKYIYICILFELFVFLILKNEDYFNN